MITFDAGSGEVCQIRRIRTNTPLQALVTMNDPVFVEASGALAKRCSADALAAEYTADSFQGSLVKLMFRSALIRMPRPEEIQRLIDLQNETTAGFLDSPESATELLSTARIRTPADSVQNNVESNAWLASAVVVASVILNLDEMVMRP